MRLYNIAATAYSNYFGTFDDPIDRSYVTIVAQKPDCSAFLFVCKDEQNALTGLTALNAVPSGYDFTYCQEWGLIINDAVVDRVIIDLRKKNYGTWENQLEEIYDHGIDNWKIRIAQVKTSLPK
tara:strand:+ start:954 stop:1325 length:372 start_codon:yes stop_codon:yes gene_type:complete